MNKIKIKKKFQGGRRRAAILAKEKPGGFD
jgi:hypothetical protein